MTQLAAQPEDFRRRDAEARLLRFTRSAKDLEAAVVAYKRAQQRRKQIAMWAGVVAVAIGVALVWGW
jgi:hypothetical protein